MLDHFSWTIPASYRWRRAAEFRADCQPGYLTPVSSLADFRGWLPRKVRTIPALTGDFLRQDNGSNSGLLSLNSRGLGRP